LTENVPESEIQDHETDEAPSRALLDRKTLGVKEVADHESSSNVTEWNDECT
jgi:hypothetical protein